MAYVPTDTEAIRAGSHRPTSCEPSGAARDPVALAERTAQALAERTAQALAWFSFGLGAVEVLAPRALAAAIGAPHRTGWIRAFGLREIAAGARLVGRRRPVDGLWARVAGDVADLAFLAASYGSRRADGRRLLAATAAVAGVTLADVWCARTLAAAGDSAGEAAEPEPSTARRPAAAASHRVPASRIHVGDHAFFEDGGEEFGAVREVSPQEIVVYVENAGDFAVPIAAVAAAHSQKVIVDRAMLPPEAREAIRHAHDAEEPGL